MAEFSLDVAEMKELDVEYDKYNKEYLKRTRKWKA